MASCLDLQKTHMKWSMCCLCQLKKSEKLITPTAKGYSSIDSDLKVLASLNFLPITVNIELLDEGPGIAITLDSHNAVYHKTCRALCNSQKIKRAQEKTVSSNSSVTNPSPKKLRSLDCSDHSNNESVCMICQCGDGELHKVQSMNVDKNLKEWSKATNQFLLHARLVTNASDAHAGDTFYHLGCYTKLRKAAGKITNPNPECSKQTVYDPLVIAQLVVYMTESKEVFKLATLTNLYRQRLAEVSRPCEHEINSTRFKEHLLDSLPDGWTAINKGGNTVFLSHNDTVGDIMAQASENQNIAQDEAILLMKAASILRKHSIVVQKPFDGFFDANCLSKPVPELLYTFMNALLQGSKDSVAGLDDIDMNQRTKVTLGICQIITYNMVKHTPSEKTKFMRHPKEYETPLPLYIALKLHSDARQRKHIELFSSMGLASNYSRVREIKLDVARAVCRRIDQEGVVVPTNMKKGVFTTCDCDNLDHLKTSNLSNSNFNGSMLTFTNHLSRQNMGTSRDPIKIDPCETSKPRLPDDYVMITPCELPKTDIFVPIGSDKVTPSHNRIEGAKLRDQIWINHVKEALYKEELDKNDIVTWSGHYSRLLDDNSIKPPAEIGANPIFPDKITDPALLIHLLKHTKKGTQFLNHGQTPVLGADQPVYALLKQIQWKFPEAFGEDKFVIMLGALHIEDKVYQMLGKVIRESGWEWVMTKADIFTSGRTSSALDEHHIKRSRYAHQVSIAAFSILREEAFSQYCLENQGTCPVNTFVKWSDEQEENYPMFFYWSMVIDFQMLLLRFVRSMREGDFELYVQTCDEICDWAFALDRPNYSRYLPIHVRDMVQLPEKHPEVYTEFMNGNFVVQRSHHKFSLMAKDQSHEHSNKALQQSGGGLADMYDEADSIALYMLAAPDTARIVQEFENVLGKNKTTNTSHHEEAPKLQKKFLTDVRNLLNVIKEKGNPFLDQGENLKRIDTRDVMEPEVILSLRKMKRLGNSLHTAFVENRLRKCVVALSDVIPKNSLYTFNNRPDQKHTKPDPYKALRRSSLLITQMFMSLKSRPNPDENIKEFMSHENARDPPSLADRGLLRTGSKSDILDCLQAPKGTNDKAQESTVILLDMAAILHMIPPTRAATFNEYVTVHVIPYIKGVSQPVATRTDSIWDRYPRENLKAQAHSRRGTGPRTELGDDGDSPIPRRDWQQYLANIENKKELFAYISKKITSSDMLGDILLLSTFEDIVLTNKPYDTSRIQPNNHIEGDTRIFLHLANAALTGHTKAYIRTVDSDIVVLAISFFHEIGTLTHLWIGFGKGKHYRDIPIHDICSHLGKDVCRALPFFHALSGCDTTSQLFGIGKKTAWDRWTSMSEITPVFLTILDNPESFTLESPAMSSLERFCVIMYSKSSSSPTLNDARLQLFSNGTKTLETLPPTSAAYFQHVRRCILQACYFWKQSLLPMQIIPNYSSWGWKYDDKIQQWVPFWTTLPDASTACTFLIKCGCKKTCCGNCKCFKAGIRCSALCGCQGGCTNNNAEDD